MRELQIARYQVYVTQELFIKARRQAAFFRKKYCKYFHKLEIHKVSQSFLNLTRYMPRLKKIYSLCLPQSKISILQRIAKIHKKHLRITKEGLEDPRVQKFLPQLDELNLCVSSNWRILTSHFTIKKLSLNFRFKSRRLPTQVQKLKTALSKSLPKQKKLTHLFIQISSQDVRFIFFTLELVNPSKPLKQLNIDLANCIPLENFVMRWAKKTTINKALEHITSLKSREWVILLDFPQQLKNLIVLELEINTEISWEIGELSRLEDMGKLKKLNFTFIAAYAFFETEFLRQFRLPPTLKDFKLTLGSFFRSKIFSGNNEPILTQFFERLKENKSVKYLIFITKNCSELPHKFGPLFIQCFTKLKRIQFHNYSSEKKTRLLSLEDFWKAFVSSRETLREVAMESSDIVFPQKIRALDSRFPRLHCLTLGGKIYHAAKLSVLLQSLPLLKKVSAYEFEFSEKKWLKQFLDGFKEVALKMDISLNLNAENIKQEFLTDYLKKFINEANVKGELSLYFKKVQMEDVANFQEILNLAKNKGCFHRFRMDREDSTEMFEIRGQKIIRVGNGLVKN